MKKTLTLALSIAFIGVFGQAKISDLPATTTLTGVELFPVVQGGVTKKTTAAQIVSLVPAATIPSSVLTTTGSQSVSNKSGNISQWTNDVPYLTSSSASVYIPYSGATSSVNLGANSLSVNATSTVGSTGQQLIFNNGVYNYGNNGSNQENVFFGKGCGTVTTSGIENAVFGLNTGYNHSIGNGNSYFGTYTAISFTNGGQNCVFGSDAISSVTVSSGNNVMGVQALSSYTGVGYNNAIGLQNMRSLITGSMNIGNGYRSAETFTNGSNNIFLGVNTSGLSMGNYNTLIGSNIVFPSTSFSNNIIIADGQGNIRYRYDATNSANLLPQRLRIGSTTAPTATLDVTGTMSVSSTATLQNNSALGTATLAGGNSGTVAVLSDALFTTTHFHGLSTVNTNTFFYDKYPSSSGAGGASGTVGATIIPFNCVLVGYSMSISVFGTLGTANNATVSVRINNTTDVTLTNSGLFSSAKSTYSSSALNTNLNAGDYIEIKVAPNCTPTAATNVTEAVTLFFARR